MRWPSLGSLRLTLLVFIAALFVFPQSRLYAADPATVGDVRWTVWHEGCNVFSGNEMNPLSELRQCAMNKQSGNAGARGRISNLSDNELRSIYLQGETDIPAQFSLVENFRWVCIHEHQLNSFRVLRDRGQYGQIRQIYHNLQDHNPNARNLLSAVKDTDIKVLIDSIH